MLGSLYGSIHQKLEAKAKAKAKAKGRSQESSATRDLKSMISLSITWAGVAQPSVLRGRPF
ncbi:hypothetical protein, partial [Luteimonas sp. TWI1416]|uniref:hypothetical protein n=1 Tax=unclassified Luteimonas TaxID=2629088 RepID=UPI00320A12E2